MLFTCLVTSLFKLEIRNQKDRIEEAEFCSKSYVSFLEFLRKTCEIGRRIHLILVEYGSILPHR